ncbi:permease for cytosine/purines, uracil, thiamine, allantoin-domain-containing protein [Aspergillus stella-maris]|uniref:permease for cytosine/purines, uracil, thiamine, allantoin-domain-containing protein n=1 Tax=Aspergillus stella-maris TaxID=1810926 RepID=UPI003CCE0EFA
MAEFKTIPIHSHMLRHSNGRPALSQRHREGLRAQLRGRTHMKIFPHRRAHCDLIRPHLRLLQALNNFEQRLGRLGGDGVFEVQGANRIADQDRKPPSITSALMIWVSFVLHLGMLPVGFLGPALGLTFKDALSACLTGIVLGAALPAYTATFGLRLGLRQMAAARFAFGIWSTRLLIVIMIISAIAFMVINMVIVGEVLAVVSGSTLDLSIGIILIAIMSYIPTFFGFRALVFFEKYSWLIAFALFTVLYIQAISAIGSFDAPSAVTGVSKASS